MKMPEEITYIVSRTILWSYDKNIFVLAERVLKSFVAYEIPLALLITFKFKLIEDKISDNPGS